MKPVGMVLALVLAAKVRRDFVEQGLRQDLLGVF